MNKYQNLAKNSGLFFIANFGSKIVTFLLVRFYTELLTTEEYGTLDLINTTVNLAIPIVTLCITEAVLRFSIDDIDNRKKIFSLGLTVGIIGNVAFALTAPLLYHLDFFKDNLLMLYLLTFANTLYMVASQFSRGIGKTQIFAIGGFLLTVLQVGLNLLFLGVFYWGIKGYLWALFIANIITAAFIFCAAKLYKYIGWNFQKSYLKDMLKYSLPLIPNSIFWWIMQSSNRYVITLTLSSGDNGLYAVANKIPTIISTISNIFFQAWQLSSVDEAKSKDKDKFYSEIFNLTALVLICMSSFIMIVLQPVYRILVEDSFYIGWQCTPFLMLSMVFSCFSSFFGTNYVAMKKTNGVFVTTLIGAIVNLVLSLVLTRFFGIRGTALATAVGFAVTTIVRAVDTRKFAKISVKMRSFWLPLAVIIVQAVLLTIGVTSMALQTAFFAVILVLCHKEIFNICRKMIDIGKGFLKRKNKCNKSK